MKFIALFFIILISLPGCKKDDQVVPVTPITPVTPVMPAYVVSTFAGNGLTDGFNGNSTISPVFNPIDIVTDNQETFTSLITTAYVK